MALTVNPLTRLRDTNGKQLIVAQVTGDNSYPAGGYALDNAALGLYAIHTVIPINRGYENNGEFYWDQATKKLLVFGFTFNFTVSDGVAVDDPTVAGGVITNPAVAMTAPLPTTSAPEAPATDVSGLQAVLLIIGE